MLAEGLYIDKVRPSSETLLTLGVKILNLSSIPCLFALDFNSKQDIVDYVQNFGHCVFYFPTFFLLLICDLEVDFFVLVELLAVFCLLFDVELFLLEVLFLTEGFFFFFDLLTEDDELFFLVEAEVCFFFFFFLSPPLLLLLLLLFFLVVFEDFLDLTCLREVTPLLPELLFLVALVPVPITK